MIFLDIEGVLHIKGDRPQTFNRNCVAALNWLTDVTDGRIVVSSTWRHMRQVSDILARQGVRAKVVGSTPDLNHDGIRGEEITAWLNSHAPRKFVILDDDNDMGDLLLSLVQTSYETGLTLPLAEIAAGVLTI